MRLVITFCRAVLAGRHRAAVAALVAGIAAVAAWPAAAGQVQVAVAANFAAPFRKISADFTAATGHSVRTAVGATGKFHAQIHAGAPFDILLAADAGTPRRLEEDGLAIPGTRFTYARGRLALWSPVPGRVDSQGEILRRGRFRHLAIANPALAPYGAAAEQAMKALGVQEALSSRLVRGESIAQAYQFVATGNAELGFVALSQVIQVMPVPGKPAQGAWWLVPSDLHAPILQDAVLLQKGRTNAAARALLDHLRSPSALAVIRAYGYEP